MREVMITLCLVLALGASAAMAEDTAKILEGPAVAPPLPAWREWIEPRVVVAGLGALLGFFGATFFKYYLDLRRDDRLRAEKRHGLLEALRSDMLITAESAGTHKKRLEKFGAGGLPAAGLAILHPPDLLVLAASGTDLGLIPAPALQSVLVVRRDIIMVREAMDAWVGFGPDAEIPPKSVRILAKFCEKLHDSSVEAARALEAELKR